MLTALLQTLLAAFCAILSAGWVARGTFAADMGGGGMIAARHSMLQKAAGWVNPYANGLTAMWDGEWNAGPGVHDATVAPTDLVSGIVLSSFDSIGQDYIRFWGQSNTFSSQAIADAYAIGNITIEAVLLNNTSTWGNLLLGLNNGSIVTTFRPNGGTAVFEFPKDKSFRTPEGSFTKDVIHRVSCRSEVGSGSVIAIDSQTYSNSSSVATATINSIALPSSNNSFYGNLYCLRLYSRALSASEIAANYAVDKARFGLT